MKIFLRLVFDMLFKWFFVNLKNKRGWEKIKDSVNHAERGHVIFSSSDFQKNKI